MATRRKRSISGFASPARRCAKPQNADRNDGHSPGLWRGRRDCVPTPLLGRPAGAVADALRCRESATSNLAAARLSNIPTSSGVPDVSPGETAKRKRAPCEGPFSVSLARPERFELPTFWFVARRSIQLSYGRVIQHSGGERGIRTLEGLLTLTPLAGARLRPLGHLSVFRRAAKDKRPEPPRKAWGRKNGP